MRQYLPTANFKWVTRPEINNLNINSIPKDRWYCCIFKVDLEYPEELHNLHNDYHLATEKTEIKQQMLSNYSRTIGDE